MLSTIKKMKYIYLLSTFFIFLISLSNTLYAAEPNPQFLIDGKAGKYSSVVIGNALGYGIKVEDQKAKTKRGNLKVSSGEKNADGDALRIKWKGKVIKNQWGNGNILHNSEFAINNGSKKDLSSYVDTHAIILEIKVNKTPKGFSTYSLECDFKKECRPSIPINNVFKNLPKKKWTNFPIPLACFNQDNFDFSKVTSILKIATQGSLDIELANVYLAELPENRRGCN